MPSLSRLPCVTHLEAGGGGGGLLLLSLMPRGSHWLADTLPPPRLLLPMPMLCLASPTVLGISGEEGGACRAAAGTAGGGAAAAAGGDERPRGGGELGAAGAAGAAGDGAAAPLSGRPLSGRRIRSARLTSWRPLGRGRTDVGAALVPTAPTFALVPTLAAAAAAASEFGRGRVAARSDDGAGGGGGTRPSLGGARVPGRKLKYEDGGAASVALGRRAALRSGERLLGLRLARGRVLTGAPEEALSTRALSAVLSGCDAAADEERALPI